jgi:hypothetical protein
LRTKDFLGLLALTGASFAIDGYHPFSEDAETYLPSIERILHPHLFPVGAEYFQLHARLTLFPQLVAYTVRLGHMSLPWALLLWQVLSFFLFILACWKLMQKIFGGPAATWAGVGLIVALTTMPVAGTALYVMDPYLNPRNIVAFAEIFPVLKVMERKYLQAVLFLLLGFTIHPLMTVFAATFCLLVLVVDQWSEVRVHSEEEIFEEGEPSPVAPALLLFGLFDSLFKAPNEAYEMVEGNHRYQYLARWTWYEMLGAVAPILIFWWFALIARTRRLRHLELLSRSMVVYGAIYLAAGFIVSLPKRLEVVALLQPMRSLHIGYIFLILIGGGLLGEYVLRNRVWRWVALFLPLSAGMCYAQRALYPASAHIEWPQAASMNEWVQAFEWVRQNTPEDAVFAIDPHYMGIQGEDLQGFRAIAERSQLADAGKDSGVVEMFPQIGDAWMAQVKAQTGLERFQRADFLQLQQQYGVNWVILQQPAPVELDCPFQNQAVKVCRVP